MFFPSDNIRFNFSNVAPSSASDRGTCRSGIGNDKNSSPDRLTWSASSRRSRSRSSSAVSNDKTACTPPRFQFAISSSTQSPPRGRASTASLPAQGPLTQWSSVDLLDLFLLVNVNHFSRQNLDINA